MGSAAGHSLSDISVLIPDNLSEATHAVAPAKSALEVELRKCDIDIEELLKEKINSKGTTLQDMKKRLDDQKNYIIKLREGISSSEIIQCLQNTCDDH